VRVLLAHPNGDDGVDDGVCHQFRHDRAAFEAAARAMTRECATGGEGGGSAPPPQPPQPLAQVNGGGDRLRVAKRGREGE